MDNGLYWIAEVNKNGIVEWQLWKGNTYINSFPTMDAAKLARQVFESI